MRISLNFDKICLFVFIIVSACGVFLSLNIWLLASYLPNYALYDKHRLLMLAVLAISTLWIVLSPNRQKRCLDVIYGWPKWVSLSLFTLFILGCFSAAFSAFPRFAFLQISLYLELGMLAVLIASLRPQGAKQFDEFSLAIWIGTWTVYCLVVAYIALAVNFKALLGGADVNNVIAVMTHPFFEYRRFLTQLLVMALPFMVLPLWKGKHRWGFQALCWLLLCFFWCLYWSQESRASWLILVVLTLYCLVVFRRESFGFLWRHGVAVVISAPLTWLYLHVFLNVSERSLDSYEQATRLSIWQHAGEVARQHLWFGLGPLNYSTTTKMGVISQPDNIVMLFFSEWGVIATAIVVLLALWVIYKQTRLALVDTQNRPWHIVLTCSLLAMAMDAQVSANFADPVAQLYMALIWGWLLGFQANKQWCWQPRALLSMRLTLILVALASLVGIAYGIFPTVFHLPDIEKTIRTACHGCAFSPNFWVVGHIQALR